MKRLATFSVGAMIALAGTAFAQTTKAPTASQRFVHEALAGGMAEVELGKLAAEKASNEDVKKFGQRMVDDHSKAGDELKMIASKKEIPLPTDLDPKDKALRDHLAMLSGPAFDRAYIRAMVSDHEKDVAAFKHQADAGTDPDVATFAGKTLPTLENHLMMAKAAEKELVQRSAKTN